MDKKLIKCEECNRRFVLFMKGIYLGGGVESNIPLALEIDIFGIPVDSKYSTKNIISTLRSLGYINSECVCGSSDIVYYCTYCGSKFCAKCGHHKVCFVCRNSTFIAEHGNKEMKLQSMQETDNTEEIQKSLSDEDTWIAINHPGYSGKKKSFLEIERDYLYGKNNWKIGFKWRGEIIEYEDALMLYEDAYFFFLSTNENVLDWLIENAKDVYDNSITNIKSGTDYSKQESESIHLQDIAIRRALLRMTLNFQGDRLIEIRGKDSEGYVLNPGQVPFHIPEEIVDSGNTPIWAEKDSIESFWQNNKVLLVKKFALKPHIAIDVIVHSFGKIALIKRTENPTGWALPGGMIRYNETAEQAAVRVVQEKTGMSIQDPLKFNVYSDVDRDPRHRIITIVYIAEYKGEIDKYFESRTNSKTRWFTEKGIPSELAFDHTKILTEYFLIQNK